MKVITQAANNNLVKKAFPILLKTLVLGVFALLIHREFVLSEQNTEIIAHLQKVANTTSLTLVSIVLLLMVVNWGLETLKWKYLTSLFFPLSWIQSIQAILSGTTLGIITPGRLGEYGGKMMYIPSVYRGKAITAGIINSLAQNIVNVFFGMLAVLWYAQRNVQWPPSLIMSLLTISTFGLTAMILLYFNTEAFEVFFSKTFIPKSIQDYYKKFNFHIAETKPVLNRILFLSAIRLAIYASQYVLLIYAFGSDLSLMTLLCGVAIIFLLQSGIPLPPILSILARAELAIFVFSSTGIVLIGLLSATFSLWIINLVLPSFIGLVILLKAKLNIQNVQ